MGKCSLHIFEETKNIIAVGTSEKTAIIAFLLCVLYLRSESQLYTVFSAVFIYLLIWGMKEQQHLFLRKFQNSNAYFVSKYFLMMWIPER